MDVAQWAAVVSSVLGAGAVIWHHAMTMARLDEKVKNIADDMRRIDDQHLGEHIAAVETKVNLLSSILLRRGDRTT